MRLLRNHRGLLPKTTMAIQSNSQELPKEVVFHTLSVNANTSKPYNLSNICHNSNSSLNSILQSNKMQEKEEDRSNIQTQTTTTFSSNKTNISSHQLSQLLNQEVSIIEALIRYHKPNHSRTSTATIEKCSNRRKTITGTLVGTS